MYSLFEEEKKNEVFKEILEKLENKENIGLFLEEIWKRTYAWLLYLFLFKLSFSSHLSMSINDKVYLVALADVVHIKYTLLPLWN